MGCSLAVLQSGEGKLLAGCVEEVKYQAKSNGIALGAEWGAWGATAEKREASAQLAGLVVR